MQKITSVSIEHIGSTAVPYLAARPIIDILITSTQTDLEAISKSLSTRGIFEIEESSDLHCLIFKALNELPPYILYLCEEASLSARAHLAIRSILRTSPGLLNSYNSLKDKAFQKGASFGTYDDLKPIFLQRAFIVSNQFTSDELLSIFHSSGASRWNHIVTPRLTLREYELEDEEGMFALESCEENARYQDWVPWTRTQAHENVLRGIQRSYSEGRATVELAVVFEGFFIGRIGGRISLLPLSENVPSVYDHEKTKSQTEKHVDLWYSFLPRAQGQGLATEAMRAFVEVLEKREGEALELEIECDPRNTGSWKMAERLGFERFSLTERAYESKGEWVDSLVYRKIVCG